MIVQEALGVLTALHHREGDVVRKLIREHPDPDLLCLGLAGIANRLLLDLAESEGCKPSVLLAEQGLELALLP